MDNKLVLVRCARATTGRNIVQILFTRHKGRFHRINPSSGFAMECAITGGLLPNFFLIPSPARSSIHCDPTAAFSFGGKK